MAVDGLVAVTGATGAIGGRVAALLAEQGVRQRLVVRDPARAPLLPGAQVAVGSYDEPDAMRAAFEGADTLLLVSAAEHPDRVRQHPYAVDAAVAAGVRRVVYTSFLGAAPDATFTLARQHWATEMHLRASGMAFTFLRDSLYLDFLPFMADVAVAVIRGDGHDGVAYDVTGGRLRTMTQWAAELSAVTGRAVRYRDETLEEAWASRASYGAPDWEVEGWITSYTAIAGGEMAVASDTVEHLTGHPPRELRDLLGGAGT